MQFSIARDALLKPLQLVTGVVERRNTMPVLANVLLVLDDDHLSITGTDLEVEIVGRVKVESIAEVGEVTLLVDAAELAARVPSPQPKRIQHLGRNLFGGMRALAGVSERGATVFDRCLEFTEE